MHPVNLLLPQLMLTHRASQAMAQFYLHSLLSMTGLNGRCTGWEAGGHGDCRGGGQGCWRKGKVMLRMDRPLFQCPPGSQASGGREQVRLPSGFGLGDSQSNESSQASHTQGHATNDGHAYQSIWKKKKEV